MRAGARELDDKKLRHVARDVALASITEGTSQKVCGALGIPSHWATRCEDAFHLGHDGTFDSLRARLEVLQAEKVFTDLDEKLLQLASYGGGNLFGECNAVTIEPGMKETATTFGLRKGASAIAGTKEANDYLDDMALGANFSTVNHMLINALLEEAFCEVMPGIRAELIYFISHNIVRHETLDGKKLYVHRKGAMRTLDQDQVDKEIFDSGILSNCRKYPRDEAPAACKNFADVLSSVEEACLASVVARLKALFVIKDASVADD